MRARISPHTFSGTVRIPASKSHTIRQLIIASLAGGVSEIIHPLDSLDTQSCAAACRILGATVTEHRDPDTQALVSYTVEGNNGFPKGVRHRLIDVGNSGTTLYLVMAAAGLGNEPFEFTGDEQIQRRSAAPLLEALAGLGMRAESLKDNGCVPIVIQGPWKGGQVSLPCPTSQYLSALLLAAPTAPAGTITDVAIPLLNERPYIEMTLSYLKNQGIPWESPPDFSRFIIPGGASWKPFSGSVPGDFSSAAFPACAAAISGNPVTLLGLDPHDVQGDKFFLEMLAAMGCTVNWEQVPASAGSAEYRVTVSRGGPLRGGSFDLNATPDLLPAAAVTAAFAEGDTALVNAAHARIKETDRIAVMAEELAKLGVSCTELPDGLIVHGKAGSGSGSAVIDSCGDHRIVMAFAAAALSAQAPIEIDGAESAAVTYPGFLELLQADFVS
ncbi:MAG: 3-phosphoshikimate 1-carboxyvinyltransferase [Treponema sp.]|jgi:3-phosphoshikimate 1-carboxyvinyltransferase|nr:3-phosphoshikimate 1-carboxyvinyltransferase [Treponema sp.]